MNLVWRLSASIFALALVVPTVASAHGFGEGSVAASPAPFGGFVSLAILLLIAGLWLRGAYLRPRWAHHARLMSWALGIVLALSLISGGLLHAVIPHDDTVHGDIWTSLHASLSHEEKKVTVSLGAILPLAFALTGLVLLCGRRFFFSTYARKRQANPLERALSRGVLLYRRFG